MGEFYVCELQLKKGIKNYRRMYIFFQPQAQLQLSVMMMILLAHSTTSPMGVILHHLQRAALMLSLLE